MDSNTKRMSKKIDVSSSSLVALKAELLNKQSEVQRVKSSGQGPTKLRRPAGSTAAGVHPSRNKGVEERDRADQEQRQQEAPTLERSRRILEEKAKLYEKLASDRQLLEEDTIGEEQSHYLVDFQQKVVERVRQAVEQRRQRSPSPPDVDDTPSTPDDYLADEDDEEWVDFVDSFGRTRRCQKKDLAEFRRRDRQPESPDRTTPAPTPTTYGNFVPSTDAGAVDAEGSSAQADVEAERKRLLREQWAKDDEINRSKTSLHYQDVLYQEARQHGAGFYAFDRDEAARAEQMAALDERRRATEAARGQRRAAVAKKQTALQQRLLKIRQRKRQKLGLPPLDETQLAADAAAAAAADEDIGPPSPEAPSSTETPEQVPIPGLRLPQSARIRPWDIGKEGVPKQPHTAEFAPVSQTTWVERKREERVAEFAPPTWIDQSSSTASTSSDRVASAPTSQLPPRNLAPTPPSRPIPPQGPPNTGPSPSTTLSEDSISAGLAFLKHRTPVPANVRPHEVPPPPETQEEEEQQLQKPAEAAAAPPRWRPKSSAAHAAIPPPPSMDYYVQPTTGGRSGGVGPWRGSMLESFRTGVEQQQQQQQQHQLQEQKPQKNDAGRWAFYGD